MSTEAPADDADRDLVRRAQAGDQSAFAELLDCHGDMVWRCALRIVNRQQEAHDVFQETWLAVHQHLCRFRGESQFRTWVIGITIRQARKALRSPWHRRWLRGNAPVAISMPEDASEGRQALRHALEQLSPRLREVVALHYLEGLSIAETSAALCLPRTTIDQRLSRARQQLRELLKDDAE